MGNRCANFFSVTLVKNRIIKIVSSDLFEQVDYECVGRHAHQCSALMQLIEEAFGNDDLLKSSPKADFELRAPHT